MADVSSYYTVFHNKRQNEGQLVTCDANQTTPNGSKWHAVVKVNNNIVGQGRGTTKREAKEIAAKRALDRYGEYTGPRPIQDTVN
ncbi:hypothetical protein C8Q75DRAFT_810947 [Abortiporus biennis]|nr:hypothetical protein C8Q75DRAFT_810947 [Abortiporus biennis]